MTINFMFPFNVIVEEIKFFATKYGYQLYIVGGFCRDYIMGVVSKDIDFVIDKDGDDNPAKSFAELLEKEGYATNVAVYEKFGTSKVDMHGEKIEFTMPRSEQYTEGSRKPQTQKIDIQGDALRRDFTVNTIMINPFTEEIVDPTGFGLEDIKNKVIRSANPNINQMFHDDALRLMRACRFSATKGFTIDKALEDAVILNAERIKTISQERIREELDKILMADKGDIWFNDAFVWLVKYILPDIYKLQDTQESPPYHWDESTYAHTIRTVYNCPKVLHIRRAALFHDVAKPYTYSFDEEKQKSHFYGHDLKGADMVEDIMRELTYSNDDIKVVKTLVKNHMRPHLYKVEGQHKWTDKAIRKFIAETGEYRDDILTLAIADSKGSSDEEREHKNLKTINDMAMHISEIKDTVHTKPILTGDDIKELFGKPSGKWIKVVIEYQMSVLHKNPNISIEDMKERLIHVYRDCKKWF